MRGLAEDGEGVGMRTPRALEKRKPETAPRAISWGCPEWHGEDRLKRFTT